VKEISYYPGCSLHGTAKEYDESIRGVSGLLDIQLHELEDWTCCGASSAHCTDEELAIDLAARNLAIAEKSSRTLLVPCVACYSRFKTAEMEVKEHAKKLRFQYQGDVPIQYSLDFFCEEALLEEVKKKRVKPLSGLKVVCYYGCLTVRPPKLTGIREYENPQHMDRLMEGLGAEPVPWSYKTDCCGASHAITQTDACLKLVGEILGRAKESGAEAVVVGCPLCHLNLDSRQLDIARKTGQSFDLPIFYFTQLLGLAFGLPEKELALKKLLTDGQPLLAKKGLL